MTDPAVGGAAHFDVHGREYAARMPVPVWARRGLPVWLCGFRLRGVNAEDRDRARCRITDRDS